MREAFWNWRPSVGSTLSPRAARSASSTFSCPRRISALRRSISCSARPRRTSHSACVRGRACVRAPEGSSMPPAASATAAL